MQQMRLTLFHRRVVCSCGALSHLDRWLPSVKLVRRLLANDSRQNSKQGPKIDFNEIDRRIKEDVERGKQGGQTELDKTFMNFTAKRDAAIANKDQKFITWKVVGIVGTLAGALLTVFWIGWKMKVEEEERNRKMAIGKAKLGGEWELVNMEGKLEGSKDLLGKWVLIYFGFTNCPDICPDEIEKMVEVVDILNREESEIDVIPVFISVDPDRDTVERVKRYCSEFSPKLRGYTGSKDQVNKVAKAFRVYHSEGPRSSRDKDDYIVDHTVIIYLVDPEGQFHDYYGQNRRAREIANVIRSKALIWNIKKKKEQAWFGNLLGKGEKEKALQTG